jgi:hypothetical protein
MSPTKNHILILLSTSEKTSFGKDDSASQSLPQKVFSALWEVESEVNNGGFSQYFLNSTSESASFVVEALEIVGASKNGTHLQECDRHRIPRWITAIGGSDPVGGGVFPGWSCLRHWSRLPRNSSRTLTISRICYLLTFPNTQRNSGRCLSRMTHDSSGCPTVANIPFTH